LKLLQELDNVISSTKEYNVLRNQFHSFLNYAKKNLGGGENNNATAVSMYKQGLNVARCQKSLLKEIFNIVKSKGGMLKAVPLSLIGAEVHKSKQNSRHLKYLKKEMNMNLAKLLETQPKTFVIENRNSPGLAAVRIINRPWQIQHSNGAENLPQSIPLFKQHKQRINSQIISPEIMDASSSLESSSEESEDEAAVLRNIEEDFALDCDWEGEQIIEHNLNNREIFG